MEHAMELPAEPFDIPLAPGGEGPLAAGGVVQVEPHVTVKGTTFTVDLRIQVLGVADRHTFTLSPANHWSDSHDYFSWPVRTGVLIAAEPARRSLRVRVTPPSPASPVDRYVDYSVLVLPGEFDKWAPHSGRELDELRRAIARAQPVGKAAGVELREDGTGNTERCALLGDRDYPHRAIEALGRRALGATGDSGSVLFACGPIADASAYVGGSLAGGIWWTGEGRVGLYGGVGAQMGGITGANLHGVYTIVIASGGKSAMENFRSYHIARGVVGEGMTFSVALLGDTGAADIYGIMYGFGVGAGAPAGAYVGACRQALLEF